MNKSHKLVQVLLSGTVLLMIASAWSVQAADATLTFTGTIVPAGNSVQASADNKTGSDAETKKSEAQTKTK